MTVLAALLLLTALGATDKLTDIDRRWLASVDHLITKAERQEFERLDEAARHGFEEAFWRSRDPNQATPENEAHEEYVRRLRYVEQHLQENEVPGVFTERGRIYLKYGPPQFRKSGEMAAGAGGSVTGSRRQWATGSVPIDIWIYDRPPAAGRGKYRIVTFVDENRTNRFGLLNDEQRPLQHRAR